MTSNTVAARGERRPEWGPWHIDREVLVLWTIAPGYRYEVDLEDCTSSARVLDWICQIARKTWDGRDAIVAGLVTALDDVLDAQAHLCSWGRSRRLSAAAIRRMIAEVAESARSGHQAQIVAHLPFHDDDLWCCAAHAEEAGSR